MTYSPRLLTLGIVIGLSIALSACTIVRDGDGDDPDPEEIPVPTDPGGTIGGGGNGSGGGAGFEQFPQNSVILDALIVVDLPGGTTHLAPSYSYFLSLVEYELAERNIFVRHLAVAPMYRRQNHHAPLLYGREHSNNTRGSLADSLSYFLSADGVEHLPQRGDTPGENLASLGMDLETATIFNPEQSDTEGQPYFDAAADGFLIVPITARSRSCGHADQACALDDQTPASFFTDTNDDGQATWLRLPGPSGFTPDRIFHAPLITAEGVNYADFHSDCTGQPNFSINLIDFLEPSEDHEYFEPKLDALHDAGGAGASTDLCTALSSNVEDAARLLAVEINSNFL